MARRSAITFLCVLSLHRVCIGALCWFAEAASAPHTERKKPVASQLRETVGSGLETLCACQDVVLCQPSLDFPTPESNGLSTKGATVAAR